MKAASLNIFQKIKSRRGTNWLHSNKGKVAEVKQSFPTGPYNQFCILSKVDNVS